MTIESLTTLSAFLSSNSRAATLGAEQRGTVGANVIAIAVSEENISNRAIAAYSGELAPKMGAENVHEEKDSHPFYYSEDDEEEILDEEDLADDSSEEGNEDWEFIDWEEPEVEDEEILAARDRLAFVMAAHDRGVFLNCMG